MDNDTLESNTRADRLEKGKLDCRPRIFQWPFSFQVYDTMDVARWPVAEESAAMSQTTMNDEENNTVDVETLASIQFRAVRVFAAVFFISSTGITLLQILLASRYPDRSLRQHSTREL
jgi:hypothetical protein